MKLIFATIILTLSGVSAFAQGKVYTRKARIADFPTCTTKIVSGGDSFLDIAFGQLAFALELFECVLQLVC